MSRQRIFICSLVLLVLPVRGPAEDGDAKEKLEGTWISVHAERNGIPSLPEEVRNLRVVITKDRITFKWPKEVNFSYKSDTTTSPKRFDMTTLDEGPLKGKVTRGIYKFEDGFLILCCNTRAGEERPTAFETKPDSGFSLYKLKREKK